MVTLKHTIWQYCLLKVTCYRYGDAIQNLTDDTTWTNHSTGAFLDYGNKASNSVAYGQYIIGTM